jgi:hypothetical protein
MRYRAFGTTVAAAVLAAGVARAADAPAPAPVPPAAPAPVPASVPALPAASEPNTLTPEEQAAGWKLLFDGKTTAGWRGFKKDAMPDGWTVEGGALVRLGGGGDIVTVQAFADFDLSLEWKVAEGGNSGILIRVTEDEGTPWATGPEMQILDNARHDSGKNPLLTAGACCHLYAPSKDVSRPAGRWNRARIVAKGPRVEHWLNGEKIVEYGIGSDDWKARVAASPFKEMPRFGANAKGLICLQDHGDRVEFRSILIREIR